MSTSIPSELKFTPLQEHLSHYGSGPLKLYWWYRELLLAEGPLGEAKVRRFLIADTDPFATLIYINEKKPGELMRFNILLSIALYREPEDPSESRARYDRVIFDFDHEDPAIALAGAYRFIERLEKELKVTPLAFLSGFKGAHVVVFLAKEVSYTEYARLFRGLLRFTDPGLVDKGYLQFNRLDRVPLTFNVKRVNGKIESRLAKIIYPREIEHFQDFGFDGITLLDPEQVLGRSLAIDVKEAVIYPKTKKEGGEGLPDWINKVVEKGLPDGRKRFIFHVLAPRFKSDPETFVELAKEFIANSCKNYGNCAKIYDSQLRAFVRSAKGSKFNGFGLNGLRQKAPDLYEIVTKVLEGES